MTNSNEASESTLDYTYYFVNFSKKIFVSSSVSGLILTKY